MNFTQSTLILNIVITFVLFALVLNVSCTSANNQQLKFQLKEKYPNLKSSNFIIVDRDSIFNNCLVIRTKFDCATIVIEKGLPKVNIDQYFELYADPILFWSADSTITWASLYISNTTQIDTIKLDFSPSGYVYI